MTVHLKILREDVTRWYVPPALGTPDTWGKPLDLAAFAQAVNKMHGFTPAITESDIAALEDPHSNAKFPRPLVEEVCLFLSRCASREHARLIEIGDIPGLKQKVF